MRKLNQSLNTHLQSHTEELSETSSCSLICAGSRWLLLPVWMFHEITTRASVMVLFFLPSLSPFFSSPLPPYFPFTSSSLLSFRISFLPSYSPPGFFLLSSFYYFSNTFPAYKYTILVLITRDEQISLSSFPPPSLSLPFSLLPFSSLLLPL